METQLLGMDVVRLVPKNRVGNVREHHLRVVILYVGMESELQMNCAMLDQILDVMLDVLPLTTSILVLET